MATEAMAGDTQEEETQGVTRVTAAIHMEIALRHMEEHAGHRREATTGQATMEIEADITVVMAAGPVTIKDKTRGLGIQHRYHKQHQEQSERHFNDGSHQTTSRRHSRKVRTEAAVAYRRYRHRYRHSHRHQQQQALMLQGQRYSTRLGPTHQRPERD